MPRNARSRRYKSRHARFSYALGLHVPRSYRCDGCPRRGVKLWREYQTFADRTALLCCDCAASKEGKGVEVMSDDGCRRDGISWTDQIGWMVPAVPAPGRTFWGYTSVPDDAVKWWSSLPNRETLTAPAPS